MDTTIGIIGYGQFGQFIHHVVQQYYPGVSVKVFSRNKAADDETFFALEDVCNCHIVCPCVPMQYFPTVIKQIAPLIGQDTIIWDICTVKMHPLTVLQQHEGLRYVCTHPMFGPFSYAKIGEQLAGLRMVVCEHNLCDEHYQQLQSILQYLQLEVVTMSAEEHDKQLAQTLFLTHYVAQMVDRAGFCRSDIDTVSFGFLMDAVESVKHDTALFQDVYRLNPYCKEAIWQLQEAGIQVHKLLERV